MAFRNIFVFFFLKQFFQVSHMYTGTYMAENPPPPTGSEI